jgi:hypothetical protein
MAWVSTVNRGGYSVDASDSGNLFPVFYVLETMGISRGPFRDPKKGKNSKAGNGLG